MKKFKTLFSREDIQKKVQEMGKQIRADYGDEPVYAMGILNGSFIFAADLIREIGSPLEVNFIKASSYGDKTVSSGDVKVWGLDGLDLTNKNVLIIEDIVDTGNTLAALRPLIEQIGPKSIKLASLLFKPSRNIVKVDIDYLGWEIDDLFVLGYGLDLAGQYRELPDIVVNEGEA
ncbi:MAG: hypoxanthine phosphoribosyltransferase [Bacteriovoracaceae bacterium]